MATMEQPVLQFVPPAFEMSAQIGELSSALSKARKSFKPIKKDSENPFYKSRYSDLSTVIDATKDGLCENELAVLQPPAYGGNGSVQIITLLTHSSGQWMKATLNMPVSKTDAQGIGSAITYGRRYAYSAILNVASEEDDDANKAVASDKPAFQAPKRKSEVELEAFPTVDAATVAATFGGPRDASPFEKDTPRKSTMSVPQFQQPQRKSQAYVEAPPNSPEGIFIPPVVFENVIPEPTPLQADNARKSNCAHGHIVPAGVSKKTGKPYGAFCKDCGAHV